MRRKWAPLVFRPLSKLPFEHRRSRPDTTIRKYQHKKKKEKIWNIASVLTYHPMTVHQYTSTGAKTISTRLLLPRPGRVKDSRKCGEDHGRRNTVSAFSRVSHGASRKAVGLRKDERSGDSVQIIVSHTRLFIISNSENTNACREL